MTTGGVKWAAPMSSRSASFNWLINLTKQKPGQLLEQIRQEYDNIPGGLKDRSIGPHRIGKIQLNNCRYHDVPCLETTQVPLGQTVADVNIYHANFVTLAGIPSVIIAAMAPQRKSEGAFWSIIWDQKIERILCLTTIMEKNKEKTSKYWPDVSKTVDIDRFRIKNIGAKDDEGYISSTLEVTDLKTKDVRLIEHVFYSDWPDKAGPLCTHVILTIAEKITSCPTKATLVHCAAGVGRTGCLLAVVAIKMKIANGEPPNIAEIVASIRQCRAHCVQNHTQYIFLYWCAVLEILIKSDISKEERSSLRNAMKYLRDNATCSQCSVGPSPKKPALVEPKTATASLPVKKSLKKSTLERMARFLRFRKKDKETTTRVGETTKVIKKTEEARKNK